MQPSLLDPTAIEAIEAMPDQETSQPNRRFQFRLGTLLLLITAGCILLGVLRSWPERAVLITVLLIVGVERLYRDRLKSQLGERTYHGIGLVLTYVFGVIAGVVVGVILGILFILLANNLFSFNPGWASLEVGAACGCLVGLAYPRVTAFLFSLLPFGP